MKKSKKKEEDNAGLLIPAGVLIGLGVGGLLDAWAEGVLIGLGAGFLAMAIVKLVWKK